MKIMGIDLGSRRTGVAVSDLTGMISGEAFVIEEYNLDRLAQTIADEAGKRGIKEIVLGYPKNMNATEGEKARVSGDFAEKLRSLSQLPVYIMGRTAHDRRRAPDPERIREKGNQA